MGNNPILLVDADGGWASGDDPKAKVWDSSNPFYNDLPEASVTRKGWDILQRMTYRTELGLDLFKFGDGRRDYAAKYHYELMADSYQRINAARDPALDLMNFASYASGAGGIYNLGRIGLQFGVKSVVTLAAKNALKKSIANPQLTIREGYVALNSAYPGVRAMMQGKGIDRAFRYYADKNIILSTSQKIGLLKVGPLNRGADVVGRGMLDMYWWDVTTIGSWTQHTLKYAGQGIPLLY